MFGSWNRADSTAMDYEEVSGVAKGLGYRDKLRLAQLLIQLARREEEDEHPASRNAGAMAPETVSNAAYAAERIRKLNPRTRKALMNSIDAMYQFRGGISEEEKQQLVDVLGTHHGIAIDRNDRVTYSD